MKEYKAIFEGVDSLMEKSVYATNIFEAERIARQLCLDMQVKYSDDTIAWSVSGSIGKI